MSRLTEYLFTTNFELTDEEIAALEGGGGTAPKKTSLSGLSPTALIAAFKAGQISAAELGAELRARGYGQEAIYQVIREALAPEEAKPQKGWTDTQIKKRLSDGIITPAQAEADFRAAHSDYTPERLDYEVSQLTGGGGGEKSRAQQQAENLAAEQAASAEEQAALAAYKQQRPGSDLYTLPKGGYREEYLDESGQGYAMNVAYDPSTGTFKTGAPTQSAAVSASKGVAFRDTLTPGQIAVLEAGGMPAWTEAFQKARGRAPTFEELTAGGRSISRDPDPGYLKNLAVNQQFPGRIYREEANAARSLRGPGQVGADALLTPFSEEEQLRYNAFGPGGLPARSTSSFKLNPETGQYEGQTEANQYSQSFRLNPETDKFEPMVAGADTDLQTLRLMQNPQQMAEYQQKPELLNSPQYGTFAERLRLGQEAAAVSAARNNPGRSPLFYRATANRRPRPGEPYQAPDLSMGSFQNSLNQPLGFAEGGGITTKGPMGLMDLQSGQMKAIVGEKQPERLIVDSNAQTSQIEAPGGQGYWTGSPTQQPQRAIPFANGGEMMAGAGTGIDGMNNYQDPLSMPLMPRMPNAAFKAMAEMRKRRRY